MEFKGTVTPVFGYEGLYVVSDLGKVYSLRSWRGVKNRELIYNINNFGYPVFSLTKNGITKSLTAHKIVTTSFIGARPENKQVRHLDGNKLNFNLKNLVYGTAKENAQDRDIHQKTAKGSRIGTSKLSELEVEEIRSRYHKRGDMVKLANMYNTSCSNIYQIINKTSRKNG